MEGRQQKNPSSDIVEGQRQSSCLCFLKNGWHGVKGVYQEKLSISYVRSNFSKSFTQHCQKNPREDVLVSVGNAKHSFKPATVTLTSPPVSMRNCEPTCTIESIASAFMFFNDETACKILLDNTTNSVAASDRIMYIKHLLTDTHKLGYRGEIFKTGDGSLNILNDLAIFDSSKPAAELLT
jgi:hypothetical protein